MLFAINFVAICALECRAGAVLGDRHPDRAGGVAVVLSSASARAYEAHQEQEAGLSTTLQENLTGVRVVKAFARQEYERDKFEKDNWEVLPARQATADLPRILLADHRHAVRRSDAGRLPRGGAHGD